MTLDIKKIKSFVTVVLKNKTFLSLMLTVLILVLLLFASQPKKTRIDLWTNNRVGYDIKLTKAVLLDNKQTTCERLDSTTVIHSGEQVYLSFNCNSDVIVQEETNGKKLHIQLSYDRLNISDTTPATGTLTIARK